MKDEAKHDCKLSLFHFFSFSKQFLYFFNFLYFFLAYIQSLLGPRNGDCIQITKQLYSYYIYLRDQELQGRLPVFCMLYS